MRDVVKTRFVCWRVGLVATLILSLFCASAEEALELPKGEYYLVVAEIDKIEFVRSLQDVPAENDGELPALSFADLFTATLTELKVVDGPRHLQKNGLKISMTALSKRAHTPGSPHVLCA